MTIRTNPTTFVAGAAVLIAACAFIPKSTSSSTGGSAPRIAQVAKPRTENLPAWQNEIGVKPDWVYVSLVNRCKKRMDYKLEPTTHGAQGIDPEPADGYKFWKGAQSYKEISMHTLQTATLWLRDGSMGDWKEAFKVEPGTSKRLEIEKGCKTVAERTDDQHYAGCYEWSWTTACPRQSRSSAQPFGCAEGTPSVEGDMSKPCRFPTEKGICTIQFNQATAGCDVRSVAGGAGGVIHMSLEHPGVCSKTITFKTEDRGGLTSNLAGLDPKQTLPLVYEKPPIYLLFAPRGQQPKKVWSLPPGDYVVKVRDDCKGFDVTSQNYPPGSTERAAPVGD